MKCFPLLKSVLDEVWAALPGKSNAEKLAAVQAKQTYLSKHYNDLVTGDEQINYHDPATRYVYLSCYVTSHANIVCTRIENSLDLSKLFEQRRVQVTCIGGGPGSDLLGILKYTSGLDEPHPALKFFLYDREDAWSESWSDVDDKLEKPISTYFQSFDVTDPDTWQGNSKYLNSDLFSMIYFASEIHHVRDEAEAFFHHLFDRAKSGALFLYVDNAHSSFYDWFDSLYAGRGVSVLKSRDSSQAQVPSDEEKTDLGEHYGRVSLKLKASIAYRMLRKD